VCSTRSHERRGRAGPTARRTELDPCDRTKGSRHHGHRADKGGPVSDPARARKLADRIQQIVAEMLERRIKDPRLGFVTVPDARLTNDLRDATVFYTVYGTDAERADSAAALNSAKGVIRSEVGKRTGVRHTPSLTFVPDAVPDNARQIDDLLARARAADE